MEVGGSGWKWVVVLQVLSSRLTDLDTPHSKRTPLEFPTEFPPLMFLVRFGRQQLLNVWKMGGGKMRENCGGYRWDGL